MKNCIYIVLLVTNLCVEFVVYSTSENNFHPNEEDGYYLEELNEIGLGNLESDVLECPTDNVITTRYKCKVDEKWVDCTRKHCCKDYVYLAGKYVDENTNSKA